MQKEEEEEELIASKGASLPLWKNESFFAKQLIQSFKKLCFIY